MPVEGLMGRKSRAVPGECRSLILELLSKRWMTQRELEEQLRWRFEGRTVRAQVRRLRREGGLSLLARTKLGEGLLGVPGTEYHGRPDLSPTSKSHLLSKEVILLLGRQPVPLGYREIAERLGVKGHVATAVLRGLSGEGKVERAGQGWVLRSPKR